MVSKLLIAFCVVVAVASAIPAQPAGGWGGPGAWGGPGGGNPWIPPWIAAAPWMPQWSPCATVGSTCLDCTTKTVCTKMGQIERQCTDPATPYCNLGSCSATPAAGCAPVAVPISASV